jgi:hypothetical protein
MKYQFFFSILLASALFGQTKSQTVRSIRGPFKITIKTTSEKIAAGTQIELEIKVLNTSTETMVARSAFQAYDGDPTYEYSCHDSSGDSVSKEMNMVGSVHDPPSIRPGETYTSTVLLDRVCDLSRPGRYEIQLSRGVPMGSHDHVVKSNKIAITVLRR